MSEDAANYTLPSLQALNTAPRDVRITPSWQAALWQHWPRPEQWPALMDLCQAAAYLHVHPGTLRKKCAAAELRHQRVGAAYRITRADLDAYGRVEPVVAPMELQQAVGGSR